MSRAFPETVKLLQGTQPAKAEDVYAAFKRDNFVASQIMTEPLTFNQEQFEKTAKALYNTRRRKQMGIDPIEYALVAGWFFKGYSDMTPEQRMIALKNLQQRAGSETGAPAKGRSAA